MSDRKYWQQAAGDTDRNYVEVCLRWDVILNGPGYAGCFPNCVARLCKDGRTSRKITDLRRFSEKMIDGDVVVLRMGTSIILGVGVVVGGYQWSDLFGDIDGWDLQHVRRVKWFWRGRKRFPTYSLKQGDTTQLLDSPVVLKWVTSLNLDFDNIDDLVTLPEDKDHRIDFSEVAGFLFAKGISSNSIEVLSREIGELTRIAKWYKKGNHPSESETVAYLAIPLLRALGWTPQKMAVEWNKVDIALFKQLPRDDVNLSVVVEAKKMGNSCLTAVSQAEEYAKSRSGCQRLIVTDGLRYGVYLKKDALPPEFRTSA